MRISRSRAFTILSFLLLPFVVSCERPGSGSGAATLASVDAEQLLQEIADSGSRYAIVNLWATWCLPCRQEFPDLIKVGKEFADRDVVVLFVSTDMEEQEEEVKTFLAEQEVPWKSYLKRGDGYDFVQNFHSQWSGVLPATFIFDGSGQVVDYWEGISTYEEIVAKLGRLL